MVVYNKQYQVGLITAHLLKRDIDTDLVDVWSLVDASLTYIENRDIVIDHINAAATDDDDAYWLQMEHDAAIYNYNDGYDDCAHSAADAGDIMAINYLKHRPTAYYHPPCKPLYINKHIGGYHARAITITRRPDTDNSMYRADREMVVSGYG